MFVNVKKIVTPELFTHSKVCHEKFLKVAGRFHCASEKMNSSQNFIPRKLFPSVETFSTNFFFFTEVFHSRLQSESNSVNWESLRGGKFKDNFEFISPGSTNSTEVARKKFATINFWKLTKYNWKKQFIPTHKLSAVIFEKSTRDKQFAPCQCGK